MQKNIRSLSVFFIAIYCLCSCNENEEKEVPHRPVRKRKPLQEISYQFVKPLQWKSTADFKDAAKLRIAIAVNRTDSAHFMKMDSVLIPIDLSGTLEDYLPFPFEAGSLKEIKKLILFSYPSQTFGAYENGILVYTGPTNMGRKKDPTPTGLFFTNWKAEESTSTFDDEWNLRWNFNIENKLGVGWHQYELPGYPASHSCLRLQEADAKHLYTWADQWKLSKSDSIELKGTPVIVFGNYDFNAPKPWLKLTADAAALNISEEQIEETIKPFNEEIINWQQKRDAFDNEATKSVSH